MKMLSLLRGRSPRILGATVALLLLVAAMSQSAGGTGTGTTPALTCVANGTAVGTGCWNVNCDHPVLLQPAQGYSRIASWLCCYNADGTLNGGKSYSCTDSNNGGCCTFVASAPACPAMTCPSSN